MLYHPLLLISIGSQCYPLLLALNNKNIECNRCQNCNIFICSYMALTGCSLLNTYTKCIQNAWALSGSLFINHDRFSHHSFCSVYSDKLFNLIDVLKRDPQVERLITFGLQLVIGRSLCRSTYNFAVFNHSS